MWTFTRASSTEVRSARSANSQFTNVGGVLIAMGFPTDFFPLLFAIPRVAGWLAHWRESMLETSPKIWRPRQIYIGEGRRGYVALNERVAKPVDLAIPSHPFNRRYLISRRAALSKSSKL